jgi:chromosome segregation ATPase
MSFTRSILRFGVIGGLALGGAVILMDNDQVAAGLAQVRAKAQNVVDSCIDDPVAMRYQLERLADQYPERIAEVQGEIAQVDHQVGEFDRDIDIASRVVAIATGDLTDLKALVDRAETTQAQLASNLIPVSIRFEGSRLSINEAYDEGRRINDVRSRYQDRLSADKVQLDFLTEQRERLAEILVTLTGEHQTYQEQLWQLDRQIDSIERNERLIELTERQQATLKSYERFGRIDNLRQLEAKLAEMRAKQEAQLQHLAGRTQNRDYESRAISDIDGTPMATSPFDSIEIDLDDLEDAAEVEFDVKSIAFLEPVVID